MADPVGYGFDFLSPASIEDLKAADAKVVFVYPDRIATARVDEYRAAGLGVIFIAESWATRAYEGYDAGKADGAHWDHVFDDHGYPPDALGYYALGDTNWADVRAHVPGIGEYARGLGDGMRRSAFGGYGSREALDVARSSSPKLTRRWKVESWPNDAQGDVDVVQIANQHAGVPYIGGTDTNWLYRLDLGQWGGPTTTKETDVLYRAISNATLVPDIAEGTVWANAGTRFLRVGAPPAGAVVLDVPGDDIASVSYEMARQRDAAERTITGDGTGSGLTAEQQDAIANAASKLDQVATLAGDAATALRSVA